MAAAALLVLLLLLLGGCSSLAYDNGAPNSRLPPLGWSSWVALSGGDGCGHAFDYCSDKSVRAAADRRMRSTTSVSTPRATATFTWTTAGPALSTRPAITAAATPRASWRRTATCSLLA